MSSLIKKYQEEKVFSCISSNVIFHGTMWSTLKRAAFFLWINQSTRFNLNITLFNSGTFLYSETDNDFSLIE
jgi:hypothetical protein